jgi:hypothetical protein
LFDFDGVGETSVGLRRHSCGLRRKARRSLYRGEGLVVRHAAAGGPNGVVQLESLTDTVVIRRLCGLAHRH